MTLMKLGFRPRTESPELEATTDRVSVQAAALCVRPPKFRAPKYTVSPALTLRSHDWSGLVTCRVATSLAVPLYPAPGTGQSKPAAGARLGTPPTLARSTGWAPECCSRTVSVGKLPLLLRSQVLEPPPGTEIAKYAHCPAASVAPALPEPVPKAMSWEPQAGPP